jgi:hypothetical protein
MSDTNYSDERVVKGLKRYFEGDLKRIKNNMMRVGETFINEARDNQVNTFIDRTGNLRSSEGYAIGFGGKSPEVNETGDQVKEGSKGIEQAQNFGEQLIKAEDKNTLVLTGFAGMEYAHHVEATGRDVITGATKRAMRRMKALIKKG